MSFTEELIQSFKAIKTVDDVKQRLSSGNDLIVNICDAIAGVVNTILDPCPEHYIVVDKNKATVIGLMVKQFKCYDVLLKAHRDGNLDSVFALFRIGYEAYIKMLYLIKHGAEAQKDYRLKSYKRRYELFQKFNGQNNPTMNVFIYKFLEDIKEDGFSVDDFKAVTDWRQFEGKSFEALMSEFEPVDLYIPTYALISDSVHSDWGDIRQLHVQGKNDNYCIKLGPVKLNDRVILPFADILLMASKTYLDWLEIGLESVEECLSELHRLIHLIGEMYKDIYKNQPDTFVWE